MSSASLDLPKGRIVSIDALRGFDMFWIMGADYLFTHLFNLMDNPVGRALKTQLDHCEWDGFRFYDLIFPLFLFIVGVSMPFALTKRVESGASKSELVKHVIKRTIVLLCLGFIYNGFLKFDFEHFRYAGVLQRIAICYFFASLIVINTGIKAQAIWAGSILVAYFAIMKLIPVPDFGAGVLTPEGNLAGYVDRLMLPGRFCCYKFGDNEGILSTLPAISTALLGVLSGHWLRSAADSMKKVKGLFIAGVSCLAAGLVWGFVFPINKLIWSSSYVLFAGGWSMILLGLFYFIIDVKGWKKWAFFFIVIGLNPITIYIAQGVFDFGVIANIFIRGFVDNMGVLKPAFVAFCVLTVKWLFLYFLYRQKIFLKA